MNREILPCFIRVHLDLFPLKSFKGQALANFLANHSSLEIKPEKDVELGIYEVERQHWVLKFDGSSTKNFAGVGILVISPKGINTTLSFNLAFKCTNNQAEYEVLVIGLEILLELGAQEIQIIGDSQLVLQQLIMEYKCNNLLLAPYYTASTQLLGFFHSVDFEYVPKESNWEEDKLAIGYRKVRQLYRVLSPSTHVLLSFRI